MLVLFKIVCNHILTLKWHDRLVKLTHPRVTASGRLKMTWEEIFPLSTWRSSQSPTGSPTEALKVHFNSPGSTGRWTSALRRALRACVRADDSVCWVNELSAYCTCTRRWAACLRAPWRTNISVSEKAGTSALSPSQGGFPLSVINWDFSRFSSREWG